MEQTEIVVCPTNATLPGCGTTFAGILDMNGHFACPACGMRFAPELAGPKAKP